MKQLLKTLFLVTFIAVLAIVLHGCGTQSHAGKVSYRQLQERKQRLEAIKKQFNFPYEGVWKYSLEKDYALIIYDKTLKNVKKQSSEEGSYNFHLYYTKLSSEDATDKNKWTRITGEGNVYDLYVLNPDRSLPPIPIDSIPDHRLSLTDDGDGVIFDLSGGNCLFCTCLYPIGSNPEKSICGDYGSEDLIFITGYSGKIWKAEEIIMPDGLPYFHVFELNGKGKRKITDEENLYLGDDVQRLSIKIPARLYRNREEIYSFIYSKYEGEKNFLAVEAENISKNSMSGDKIKASTFNYNSLLTATRIKSVEKKENSNSDDYLSYDDLFFAENYYELTLTNGIKVHLLDDISFYFGYDEWLLEYDYDTTESGKDIFAVLSLDSARWKKDESYPYGGYLQLKAQVLYVGEVPNQYKQFK